MPSSINTKRRQAWARWTALLLQHFPSFSLPQAKGPQAKGLALWEPHWERMLRELAQQVPTGWQVLVLTDRGHVFAEPVPLRAATALASVYAHPRPGLLLPQRLS